MMRDIRRSGLDPGRLERLTVSASSWPGLIRQSIPLRKFLLMDARAFASPKRLRPLRRVRPAHDELGLPELPDGFLDAVEDVLPRQRLVEAEALERVLRAGRIPAAPRATVTPSSRQALNRSSSTCAAVKSISTMPLASITSSFGARPVTTASSTSLRKPGALRKESGACRPTTATPGTRSPAMCGCAGHQIVVPGTRSNSTSLRARRAPDAVQQRQDDAERRALLDRQHDDQRRGREDQQELGKGLPIDRDDLLRRG